MSVLGRPGQRGEAHSISWSRGCELLLRAFDCCAEGGTLVLLLLVHKSPAHTAFSPLSWNQFFKGSKVEISLLFFRSSVPAVPLTLLHYLAMARWSLSVFALTVTCSMSLRSIVTKLVSDILNYWCVSWSLTQTDRFDLSQELTWKRDLVRACKLWHPLL